MRRTPPGAPHLDDWIADPSSTFVGEPGSSEVDAHLAALQAALRADADDWKAARNQTNDRVQPERYWDITEGRWIDYSAPSAPDPSQVDQLAQVDETVKSFDFPDDLCDSLPVEAPDPTEGREPRLVARLLRWLSGYFQT